MRRLFLFVSFLVSSVSRDGQSLTISVELTGLSDVLPAFTPGGITVPAARSVSLGGK
jgi:hypothetical protein